jgi:coniferyl-alcohol glucosyltransferase
VVGRQEIEKMVRTIMEDEERNAIRARVKELKQSAERALSMGGSSFNALSELANQLEVRMQRRKEKVYAP